MLSSGRSGHRFRIEAADAELPRLLARTLVVAQLSLLVALSLLLAVRRLAGGFERPLEANTLLISGGALALVGILLRAGWRYGDAGRAAGQQTRQLALTTLVLLSAAAVLSLPRSGAWALAGLWAPVAAAEGVSWGELLWRRGRAVARRRDTPRRISAGQEIARPAEDRPALLAGDGMWEGLGNWLSAHSLPPGVSQQIVRTKAGGAETVACRLRGAFSVGQRTLNLHVGFCPPLAAAPKMHVRQTAGPPVRIDASFAQPYGARFELRLAQASREPVEVLIEAIAQIGPLAEAEA